MTITPQNDMLPAVIAGIEHNLSLSDCLTPTFFVGNDNDVGIIPATFQNKAEKDKASRMIKDLVSRTNATFVVMVAESWMKALPIEKGKPEPEMPKSIAGDADAKEIVLVHYETPLEVWSAMIPILPGRKMGEVKWEKMDDAEGRFAQFFPRNKTVH